jgi:MFS family permease
MDVRTDSREEKPLTHREARLIVLGMLLPVFMSSLDNTNLASALPTIGREFGDVHSLSWVISIYLLASTASIPLYGKISDIYGRRFVLRIGIGMYLLGSLVCALAPNMLVLIFGRALHGLGGGGLSSMGAVVLGDVSSPKERGRYYAYFAATYTTAGAIGPALGGFLSDHIHWSAIFWLNIVLGLTAATVTMRFLRRLPRNERPHRLDIIGAILIVAATVSFMLGLNLGSLSGNWLAASNVTLFAAAFVLGACFVWRLATAPEPLIPIAILRNPAVRCCVVASGCGWVSIVVLNIFLPTYLQNVVGYSATDAGLSLITLMITLNTSAGLSGYALCHMKHYKILPMIATLVAIAAMATLAMNVGNLTLFQFEALLFLIGIGFGPLPGLTQTAMANSVERYQLGISVGMMTFTRNLLATILIAVFGALVADTSAISAAAPFQVVFFGSATLLAIAFVALLLLEEKPLQSDTPAAK